MMAALLMIQKCFALRALRACILVMIAICLQITKEMHVLSFVTSPLLLSFLHCSALWGRNLWTQSFFCKSCHFSMSHQLFRTKWEVSDSLFPTVFFAFFQHHIAGFWREHLLKVFQKFEKIEADATLSTLVEFSILGQIRFASLGSVKFAVTCSLSLMVFLSVFLPTLIHSATHSYISYCRPLCLSLVLTQRFAHIQALNFWFTIIVYNEA